MLFQWIDSLFEWGILIISKWFGRLRYIIQQVLTVVIFCLVVLWLSMFLYGCFYYTYMPTVTHERNLHFHFRTDCPHFGDGFYCSFPEANVTLVKDSQSELLMKGQTYVVSVDLDMPESPVNQNHGMFMTLLQFYTRYGEVVRTSTRSSMLRYKSVLYQMMETFFYLPSLLLSTSEQKQSVQIEFFTHYQEDPYKPAVGVYFQIQSRKIEVYTAKLKIHATFYGLRYILFHWPTVSAFIGISINAFFISLVLLIAWCNVGRQIEDLEQMKKIKIREDLIKEKGSRNGGGTGISFQSASSRPSVRKPVEVISALDTQSVPAKPTSLGERSEPVAMTTTTSGEGGDVSLAGQPEESTTLLSPPSTSRSNESHLRHRQATS